jgi:hypothetical protein
LRRGHNKSGSGGGQSYSNPTFSIITKIGGDFLDFWGVFLFRLGVGLGLRSFLEF